MTPLTVGGSANGTADRWWAVSMTPLTSGPQSLISAGSIYKKIIQKQIVPHYIYNIHTKHMGGNKESLLLSAVSLTSLTTKKSISLKKIYANTKPKSLNQWARGPVAVSRDF
jgi:hypothetical protein